MDSAIENNVTISCVSFNMHGFTQGIHELTSLTDRSTSIIFLQEVWLSEAASLEKFDCFCENYDLFYFSAIEAKLSQGILRGRPHGGLAILIHKNFSKYFAKVELLIANENFILLRLDKFCIGTVYFPCIKNAAGLALLESILDNLISSLAIAKFSFCIIGGDINCNIKLPNKHAKLINDKFSTIDLCACNAFLDLMPQNAFTFHVTNRQASSLIDFFFVSSSILSSIFNYQILYDDVSLSDHLPIMIECTAPISDMVTLSSHGHNVICNVTANAIYYFDWNINCRQLYYELTRLECIELHKLLCTNFDSLKLTRPEILCESGANQVYGNFMHCLVTCAYNCFPLKNSSGNKHKKWWWDHSLIDAKKLSISTFSTWRRDNFSFNSAAHLAYKDARRIYKNLIAKRKHAASFSLSHSLGYSLSTCESKKFWNLWNANFNPQKSIFHIVLRTAILI